VLHPAAPAVPPPKRPDQRSAKPLLLVLLVCLTPVVLAFLAYYLPATGLRPDSANNYGTLIQPQRPVPDAPNLGLTTLDGEPFDLRSLAGKWVLLAADTAQCGQRCATKLFILRNAHASQGKNVDRLRRVWFVLDDGPVPDAVLQAYRGTLMLRVDPARLAAFLTPDVVAEADAPRIAAETDETHPALQAPMWVMDPLGNLMLSFPGQADPLRVRKDISKLLYHSRIG